MDLEKTKSLLRILNFSIAVAIISLLSSLPYLHEVLTYENGNMQKWVPNLGIREYLINSSGKYFNYSSYRKFLFNISFNLFAFSGFLGWFVLNTYKVYRKAILLPLVSITYQIVIILSSARTSWFNQPEVKFLGTLIVTLVLVYFYFPRKNKIIFRKTAFLWCLLFLVSLLPYLHDIVTNRQEELRSFIPFLGIEKSLTHNGQVLGWSNYRVFLFVFCTHLFAQIGWACWFFDARNRLFRPFLLVPIVFNLYEITIISININAPSFNKPDWKLYTTIIIATLIAVNLYFNSDKALEWMERNNHN
ncbi:hypothetical protein [uncultured Maribacter sp.]|uniref:hypothetical protein n=1 Tax=uncultured Maribacter sp. TaxID=431308 RepID=UPI002625495F|nr:hypothetical protein [uncultured Maribacter sp.]